VDELSQASNDMKNLLESTDIATLFLDSTLRIRRFTTRTAKIINLIPSDAGRPITDIASGLDYRDLAKDAQEVLRTLVFMEKQVAASDGHWFRLRIMPYRTLENRIDGVVITFTDITDSKTLEAELHKTQAALKKRVMDQTTELGKAHEDLQVEMDRHKQTRKDAKATSRRDTKKETRG